MADRKIPSRREIEAVLALPGPDRYSHFIKTVAGWREAWGLYDDGWAAVGDDEGMIGFPLWPAREYAELCATGIWENYSPESIPLDDLIEELLPGLKDDGLLPALFCKPSGQGLLFPVDRLLDDLRTECAKYE